MAFARDVADRLIFFEDGRLTAFEGGMRAYEERRNMDRTQEDRRVQITALQMRMAELSARLAAPRKGDDPMKLNEDYLALAREIRDLQAEDANRAAKRSRRK